MSRIFKFKHFEVDDSGAAMKVGTDAVLLGCCAQADNPNLILDIGTGSGLIALQLAQRFSNALVHGIEIDPEAAAQAERNFNTSPWKNRMLCFSEDVLIWQNAVKYDLIVCNPPFYPSSFPIADNQRVWARTHATLNFESLAVQADRLSGEQAWFWYVLPSHVENTLALLLRSKGWYLREVIHVSPKLGNAPHRTIAGWSKTAGPENQQQLYIRSASGNYTSAYLELTRDFYLFA